MRIGIIGAGHIARTHLEHLTAHPEAQVTAVVDIRAAAASALAAPLGAVACASVAEALPLIDAAYVLVPPRARVETVLQLARAGVPTLCEKPLASGSADGRAITEAVLASSTPFMMGFMRRWHPPYQELRGHVRAGGLGRLLALTRRRFGHLALGAGNWRTEPGQAVGMTLESLSHDLDLLRWLGGEIVAAEGRTVGSRADLPDYDDTVLATVQFADGAIGSVQASWMSAVQRNSLTVVGDVGTAEIRGAGMWRSDTLETASLAGPVAAHPIPEHEAVDMGFVGETATFLALARGERVEHPGVVDGLRTVELSEQILASSRG